MADPEWIIIAILTTAGFVRGAFGFADALVAMPLLLLMMPASEAAPLMAIMAGILAVVILIREWREVSIRPALLLVVAGVVGIPIGIWAGKVVAEDLAHITLGVVVLSFALWSLWKPDQLKLQTDRTAPVFGLVAGILGGAYNTSGPPLVFYAALRRWPPQKFRATMQAYTIISATWLVFMHSVAGNVTSSTLTRLATAAPFIIVATVIGQRLTEKLATERFIRWIYRLLVLLGIALFASGVL